MAYQLVPFARNAIAPYGLLMVGIPPGPITAPTIDKPIPFVEIQIVFVPAPPLESAI